MELKNKARNEAVERRGWRDHGHGMRWGDGEGRAAAVHRISMFPQVGKGKQLEETMGTWGA